MRLHDAFGGVLHHRNMCRSASDVDFAFHADKSIKAVGRSSGKQPQPKDQGGTVVARQFHFHASFSFRP